MGARSSRAKAGTAKAAAPARPAFRMDRRECSFMRPLQPEGSPLSSADRRESVPGRGQAALKGGKLGGQAPGISGTAARRNGGGGAGGGVGGPPGRANCGVEGGGV